MEQIEAIAEQIYEYICAHRPDGKNPVWPHSPFKTLHDSAQHHYRCAARFALNESNRRAERIAAFLSYKAAEFHTRPSVHPRTAVLEAISYAGLEAKPVQLEVDGVVVDLPKS